jgi:hypothetical protein
MKIFYNIRRFSKIELNFDDVMMMSQYDVINLNLHEPRITKYTLLTVQ